VREQQVTIRSVAIAAGVSMSTVPNVLSGRHELITVETRERVLAATALLNYQPNHAARSLATKRTATIGLVMSDLTNLPSPPIIPGAEFGCRNAGHSLPLVNIHDLEAERAAVETMRDKQVDGLLFSVSFLETAPARSGAPSRRPSHQATRAAHRHATPCWLSPDSGSETL